MRPKTRPVDLPIASYQPQHFRLAVEGAVATVTLDRPERKNPLTFESYRELTDFFLALQREDAVKVVRITGAGGNFSSGGDVHEIIGPLVAMETHELLAFTRMTGDFVKAIRACPQPVLAVVDGICVGAGAIMAMASDIRLGTDQARVAFLFSKVGLAGCDMGACAILPRLIGHGRASELLITGRTMSAREGFEWGFFNKLCPREELEQASMTLAREIAEGPTFATAMTKRMLAQEWAMSVEEAIEAEATAQALCMTTKDFARAYHAFASKTRPTFEGN